MSEWLSITVGVGFLMLMSACIIICMVVISCVDGMRSLDDNRPDREHAERMALIAAGIDPDARGRGKPPGMPEL